MSARHPLDVISLVFGLIFLAAAGYWGLSDGGVLPGSNWFLPVLLISVGAIGLLGARQRGDGATPTR
ncbi:hypothetical protein BH20ACT5_BH20ACT5_00390 [soil metagenome]